MPDSARDLLEHICEFDRVFRAIPGREIKPVKLCQAQNEPAAGGQHKATPKT
jgi:hypothetical protein